MSQKPTSPGRRDFLATSTAALAGATLVGGLPATDRYAEWRLHALEKPE